MRNRAIHTLSIAAALLLLATSTSAQIPTAIDKVNITPPNQKVPRFLEGSDDTIAATHITLLDLLEIEYHINPDNILGLTDEQRTTRFDIVAKIDPPGVASPEHDPHAYAFMIHALLRDHFHITAHETQESVLFEQLMTTPDGTKRAPCLPRRSHPTIVTSTHIASGCMTTYEVATRLSKELHIEVDDRTNLRTAFAVDLTWSPEPSMPPQPSNTPPKLPQSLLSALQTQLGLVLAPSWKQEKVLVIDSAALPPNLDGTTTAIDDSEPPSNQPTHRAPHH